MTDLNTSPLCSTTSSSPSTSLSPISSLSPILSPSPVPSPSACAQSHTDDFEIPWSKFPTQLITCIEKELRPPPSLRNEMVRVIINSILKKNPNPSKGELEIVAKKIVLKHPKCFMDTIEGEVIGTGVESLVKQLVERRDNVRRSPEVSSYKRKIAADSGQDKIVKKKPTDSYGCVNWQPPLPSDCTEITDARDFMKQLDLINIRKEDLEKAKAALKLSFPLQRQMINGGASLIVLQDSWPFLFEKEGLVLHFEELLGLDLYNVLNNSLSRKVPKLLAYFQAKTAELARSNTHVPEIDDLVSKEDVNSVDVKVAAVISWLMAFFKEDTKCLFTLVEATTPAQEVLENTGGSLPTHPAVVMCGPTFMSCKKFMLVCEGEVIIRRGVTSFVDAIALLFAAYYVFNIAYPQGAAATLDFIQRCFFQINPTSGSKSQKTKGKKVYSTNIKVIRLLNEITEYEWHM